MATATPPPSDHLPILASRAATLAERLAQPFSGTDAGRLDAGGVLHAWRAAVGQPNDVDFAAHVGWHGLTVEDVASRCARALHLAGPLPPWVAWYAAAAAATADLARGGAGLDAFVIPSVPGIEEPPFVELALPWLIVARTAVRAGLDDAEPPLPLEPLEAQLLREFGTYAGPTLLDTFTRTRDAQTGDERGAYRSFISAMLDGGVAAVFDACPVLARQLSTITARWVETTLELCARFGADRAALERTFGGGRPGGPVTAVTPGLSDPHDGRRRVVMLEFAAGWRVVYKPRDPSADAAVSDLLAWAHARGLEPRQQVPRMLARDRYGWYEAVEPAPTQTPQSARQFFAQAGGLLAWAHLLSARDLHMENIVATAEGPVVIDLEAILQPLGAADPAEATAGLESGLLSAFQLRADGGVADVGGLAGAADTGRISTVRTWQHLRSAAISMGTAPAPPPSLANGVYVGGRRVLPADAREHVLDGFAATYTFLLRHRSELLSPSGPLAACAATRVRVVPRPTDQYASLLQALAAPKYLADGAVRGAWLHVFARPHIGTVDPPPTWPILLAEQRALEELDVPKFWIEAGGTTLHAGSEPVSSGFASASGLAAACTRLARWSPEDLARQRRALAQALTDSPHARFTVPVPAPSGTDPDPAPSLVAAAVALAESIEAAAASGGVRPPDGVTLYDGSLGLPLFHAALARVTGHPKWRTRAEEGLRALVSAASDGTGLAAGPVGIASGWGSILYGLGLLGRLLDRPDVHEAAVRAALAGGARAGDPAAGSDLTDGQAGLLLAYLSLDAHRPTPQLVALAEACGTALESLERRTPEGSRWPAVNGRSYVGFAHGVAGVAAAASALAQATGHARWQAMADRAWEAVSLAARSETADWPVAFDDAPRAPAMTAWCHGSPGILIGLSRALDFGGGSAILAHARAAVTRLSRVSDHGAEHVCCGNLGRTEALLAYGMRSESADIVAAARGAAMRTVARAAERGHVRLAISGFRYPVFDTGFFRGLSGVGYAWLRVAAPEALPSVLGFD